MFSKETYIARRAALVEEMRKNRQTGLLLFLGNDESAMNYAANPYPYRQDSTFLYFFGLDFPGLAALIDLEDGKAEVYSDELTIDSIIWKGASQDRIKERCAMSGVDGTDSTDELKLRIHKAISKGRMVHFLPAYRAEHYVKLFNLSGVPDQAHDDMVSIPFVKAVISLRSHKSPEEIEQMEDAANISADMHLAMLSMLHPGMTEMEIVSVITGIALRRGFGMAFPPIATVNGQVLNNHWYGNTVKDGDVFLLNAGAENRMHYAGDISTTAPVGKRFTERQRQIYDIVLHAHKTAVESLRPGIPFVDIHLKAAEIIAGDLKAMGLMKGNVQEAVHEGAHALFFPSGLGHMIGLDSHDMEALGEAWVGYDGHPRSTKFGLKSLRLARTLEEGYTLTIEPGVYFIPELIDMWRGQGKFKDFLNYDEIEKFRDFGGMRTERNYLITADGCRRLGKYFPITADEVEAMR
ncbi:MAG TPA: aminopeptidase P N-terminal domain-containing protein [Candidatus Coprenecus stercoravium]|uniref:Xaa-Pro aminopeptidase n=1 Tax=Candidatus Coprenecus stercoravium TaxID=2840735 RepID=A0A9D2K9Q7_9BACT|nr:aminopeptidase P N-terminal domain-containing protein [Candidatus Coprenecus stercoravium]